ncbi:MAG: sugar transferase [Actinobacteria bacterium]|nr:sugar transferase [Actinomycetota bacterium]
MKRGHFIVLSLLLDALLINVGIVASFFLRFGGTLPAFNFEPFIVLAPFITLLYLGCGYIYGLYEPERTEYPWAVVRAVFAAATLGTALTAALLFFAGPEFFSFSRLVILISWLVIGILLIGWRILFLQVSTITWPQQRIVIVGTGDLALELASELEERGRWGYQVVGLLETSANGASAPVHAQSANTGSSAGAPVGKEFAVLGRLDEIAEIVQRESVDRVIVVSPVALRDLIERLALADEINVRVDVVPELYEIFIGTVDGLVADIPLMEITRSSPPRWVLFVKRAVDVIGALLLLLVLLPLLAITALAILVTMGWPILYSQRRTGKDMREFRLYKFRTMVREAESTTGPVLAAECDARVTPLGRILRTYRIDELPQLINILLGHMSFVGPRPERPFFVRRYVEEIPGYRERFKVAPGVTGLAQVSGGYATTTERKLKYDLIYMYHHDLSMDIQILVETVRVILTGRGAR